MTVDKVDVVDESFGSEQFPGTAAKATTPIKR